MVLNCAGETRKRDVTTMFTYSHANTPLGQSERAYYLSYFIIYDNIIDDYSLRTKRQQSSMGKLELPTFLLTAERTNRLRHVDFPLKCNFLQI